MELTTGFVVAEPEKLPLGVCTRCGDWRPGWGAGHSGLSCIKTQHAGGEVGCHVCSRCGGSGKEPPRWFSRSVWFKPWTWFYGEYRDAFGNIKPKPLRYPLERHL